MAVTTTTPIQRNYNERLILSLLRRHKQLPKADLARYTGLSPTAAGTIIGQLESDGLVLKGDPQRGKVGQPSVPYRINPNGSFAFGLKIGRRSTELVLLNALMEVTDIVEQQYPFPNPAKMHRFVEEQTAALLKRSGVANTRNVCGLGVAMPFNIWSWHEEMGLSADAMEAWKVININEEWRDTFDWPVLTINDATAACAAELALNPSKPHLNALYFYMGWFIGGGVILDGKIHEGSRRNSGAIGPMPICDTDENGKPLQLIRIASIYTLEREIAASENTAINLHNLPDWSRIGSPLDLWISTSALGISRAIASAASVIDFEAVVIDGALPEDIRHRLLHEIRHTYYSQFNLQGLSTLDIVEGHIGHNARAIGAACRLMTSAYGVDLSDLP